MQNSMESRERNYGIDLLRILAAFMVLVLHIITQGDIQAVAKEGGAIWVLSSAMQSLCLCAVNCFGIVSGYVLCRSRFKLTRILHLWAEVWFYSMLLTAIRLAIAPGAVTLDELLGSLFPILRRRLWYASAYFALFFLSPFLNRLLRSLNRRQHFSLVAILLMLFSVLTTLSLKDCFGVNFTGHSTLWLLVLYVLGAYLRCYPPRWSRRQCAAALGVSLALTLGSKLVLAWGTRLLTGESMGVDWFLREISPTVVATSICLFWIFRNLKIRAGFLKKAISWVAPLSFGAYVIQMQPLFWDWMVRRFDFLVDGGAWMFLPLLLGLALLLFAILLAAGFLRDRLFRVLRVNAGILRLESGLTRAWKKVLNRLLGD